MSDTRLNAKGECAAAKVAVAFVLLVWSGLASAQVTLLDGTSAPFVGVTVFKNSSDLGYPANSGAAQILLNPQLVAGSHHVGEFMRPDFGTGFSNLTGGSTAHIYTLWNAKVGDSANPVPAGKKGTFSIYEGNIETSQTSSDVSAIEGVRLFAGTVVGHGGARLSGSVISLVSDTTAATIVGHDLGILKYVSGGTQYGYMATVWNPTSEAYYPGTAAFAAMDAWTYGFLASNRTDGNANRTGTAAFKSEGGWTYGFDGGGFDVINIGNITIGGNVTIRGDILHNMGAKIIGDQSIKGPSPSLTLEGISSSWFTQVNETTGGGYRIYDNTYGDRYTISKASTATHAFTGNATISGAASISGNTSISGTVTIAGLTGASNHPVYATAGGVLTNSSSDARLKTNIAVLTDELDVLSLLEDKQIRGVFYDWKDRARGNEREIGFTAQMFEAIPGLTGASNDGYVYLNYDKLTALLWEQNRLLLAQNRKLAEQVRAIEAALQTLQPAH